MFKAGMKEFLLFFLGWVAEGGGGGAHLSSFCVALAVDSNKCYCIIIFKAFLLVCCPPAKTDNPRSIENG